MCVGVLVVCFAFESLNPSCMISKTALACLQLPSINRVHIPSIIWLQIRAELCSLPVNTPTQHGMCHVTHTLTSHTSCHVWLLSVQKWVTCTHKTWRQLYLEVMTSSSITDRKQWSKVLLPMKNCTYPLWPDEKLEVIQQVNESYDTMPLA